MKSFQQAYDQTITKKLTLVSIILIALPFLSMSGQTYNPYVSTSTIIPTPLKPVELDGTGTLMFEVGNSGDSPLASAPDSNIVLRITLSNGEPDGNPLSVIGGTFAGLFSWTYDGGTYSGIQNSAIAAHSGGSITIAYRVTMNSPSSDPGNGFSANIIFASYQPGTNDTEDDLTSVYTFTQAIDFGDAPSAYGVAQHAIDFSHYLGSIIDDEDANQASADADGDDMNGQDDEDGVVFPVMIRGTNVDISVKVIGSGYINAWIDWNIDNDFDDMGEKIINNANRQDETDNFNVSIPGNALVSAPTFARFRFGPRQLDPSGQADFGEVEDYQIVVLCNKPSAPVIGTIMQPNCSTSTGSVVLNQLPDGNWTLIRNPGGVSTSGSVNSFTVSGLSEGAYTFTVINSDECTSDPSANVIINPPPTIPQVPVIGTITQPSCALATGSVALSGLPSSGTWTLTRIPGDITTTGTGTITTISGLLPGIYNYTVTNSSGCVSMQSGSVVINPQPPPIPSPVIGTITHPTCTNSNGSVVLSGLPATGNWSLLRNPGGVIITGTGTNGTISLPAGTHTFTVTNAAGCSSLPSPEVRINEQPVAPPPPLSGSITQPSCSVSTGTVMLNGLPAQGTWTLTRYPGTIITTGTGITSTIPGLATGTYNFTVTNAAGCTSSISSNIVIAPQPVTPSAPSVGTITQPTCVVPAGSVNLTGLPAQGTWTLTRTPGNLSISGTGTSTTIAGLMVGTYTFSVTSSAGCQSSQSANVDILPNPLNPTIVINQPDPVCSPSTVDLTSSSVTAGSTEGLVYSYWTNPEGTIPYNTPATASIGTYYIKGTTQALCSDIKPVTVDVRNNTSANAGPDQVLEYHFSTSLNADDPGTGETGTWSVYRGSGHFANPNNAKTNVSDLSVGKNIFLWVVTNEVCTPALDSLIITVNDLVIPTLITPNNDGKNDYLIIKGIESQEEATLTIFDRRGLRVFEDHNYDNTWDGIDENGEALPDDTYFYIVESAGRNRTGYIVIRR